MKSFVLIFVIGVFSGIPQIYCQPDASDNISSSDGLGELVRDANRQLMFQLGRLDSKQIQSMIPHLEAVESAVKDNLLGTIFHLIRQLCDEHKMLQEIVRLKSIIEGTSKPTTITSDRNNNAEKIKENTKQKTDSKIPEAAERRDARLQRAEKAQAEAIAKEEATRKQKLEECHKIKQNIETVLKKAGAAADEVCENEWKNYKEIKQRAENKYKGVETKAAEQLKVAEEERNSSLNAARQEGNAVIDEADTVLQEAEKKYQATIEKSHSQYEKTRIQAVKRKQLSKKQYENALSRKMSDRTRRKLKQDLDKAEDICAEAIKFAKQKLVEQQDAAEAVLKEAKKRYDEIVSGAEDKLYEAEAEANKVEQAALEEYFKKLEEAEIELDEEKRLAFENKEKACEQTRYKLWNEAYADRNGALKEVEAKWNEIQNVTAENINRIKIEYQEEVKEAMKEYQDALDKTDKSVNTVEKNKRPSNSKRKDK